MLNDEVNIIEFVQKIIDFRTNLSPKTAFSALLRPLNQWAQGSSP